jgi:mRNA interferase MazF
MTKGEIWTTDLPRTNGHEQHGERPAVIVADPTSSLAIVVPCTSNLDALRFPHTLRVSPTEHNGLALPSILLALQLRVIDKKRLQRKIGTLEEEHLAELNKTLKAMLVL